VDFKPDLGDGKKDRKAAKADKKTGKAGDKKEADKSGAKKAAV
jgi:hypothetical protein